MFIFEPIIQKPIHSMAKKSASMDLSDSFEKIPVHIFPDLKKGSQAVARVIADLIREKQAAQQTCVLGLATGSTPKTMYAELVRMHREENLSFANVVAFNLDEYYPIENDALQSYRRFMRTHLLTMSISSRKIFIFRTGRSKRKKSNPIASLMKK